MIGLNVDMLADTWRWWAAMGALLAVWLFKWLFAPKA